MILVSVTAGGFFVFFFQAEDGIRDLTVTGVQTCALPIVPALAKATPKRLTDAIAHARRARICDYVDCARWLVKSGAEVAPPFKKVWRMKEVETPHGAFGYRAPGAGRAFDRRR